MIYTYIIHSNEKPFYLFFLIYDCSRLTALPKFLEINFRKQFLFYGKGTTSKFIVIRKALKFYISLRAEVAYNSSVTPGEGSSFFQTFISPYTSSSGFMVS
ncbi:hypothetical protein Anas_11306 [Armadillidium nasatum]|uniref:Uncharacterized protein n=1 Tax=Armadillidium nasatum TaxID=96803 RepID=A0A5N5SUC0_9CRUS|nr:hypothetical protein Anas_11306 [Armadillidium nasatum]